MKPQRSALSLPELCGSGYPAHPHIHNEGDRQSRADSHKGALLLCCIPMNKGGGNKWSSCCSVQLVLSKRRWCCSHSCSANINDKLFLMSCRFKIGPLYLYSYKRFYKEQVREKYLKFSFTHIQIHIQTTL